MKYDEYSLWVDDGRGVLLMNSTMQWNIVWNMALFPPLEMLPPDTLLSASSCNAATNSEHLFGFAPCILPVPGEQSEGLLHEQK
jgi:hypothetical protein